MPYHTTVYKVPYIIEFIYYHCTSIDYSQYSVLCGLNTLYLECTTQYYTSVHTCKGSSHITMIAVQNSPIEVLLTQLIKV